MSENIDFIRFSIVIITLNEEGNIERCLRSIKGLTDDLVVVDSGSTDRTTEICLQFGARLFTRTFDNYSDQKNYANQLARYDWIISIDADEEVDEHLYKVLKTLQFRNINQVGVFNRKTNYCGKWIRFSGLRNDYIERIFNKANYQWKGDIHEMLHPKPESRIVVGGRLNHYTYTTYDDHIKAMVNYTKMQAEEYQAREKKIRNVHLVINPSIRFLKHYIFNLGFLDGFEGYLIARISAFGTFSKYARAKWLTKQKSVSKMGK